MRTYFPSDSSLKTFVPPLVLLSHICQCGKRFLCVCKEGGGKHEVWGWQAEQRDEGEEKGAERELGFEHMEPMKGK